jgi:hypothetical protein
MSQTETSQSRLSWSEKKPLKKSGGPRMVKVKSIENNLRDELSVVREIFMG